MPKNMVFRFKIKVFNISIHKAKLVLDNKWMCELENIKSGEEIAVPFSQILDQEGNAYPEHKNPEILEIKASEGEFKFQLK